MIVTLTWPVKVWRGSFRTLMEILVKSKLDPDEDLPFINFSKGEQDSVNPILSSFHIPNIIREI